MLITMNEKLDSLILLRDTVTNMERSLQRLSAKYDEVLEKMARQEGEITALKK